MWAPTTSERESDRSPEGRLHSPPHYPHGHRKTDRHLWALWLTHTEFGFSLCPSATPTLPFALLSSPPSLPLSPLFLIPPHLTFLLSSLFQSSLPPPNPMPQGSSLTVAIWSGLKRNLDVEEEIKQRDAHSLLMCSQSPVIPLTENSDSLPHTRRHRRLNPSPYAALT